MNISINNININYRSEGAGDTVVLLHGWGSNIKLFDGIFDLMSGKYNVVALDMPGFGLSEEPKEPWGVDEYVDFVIEFLKALGIKKASFLGHSFGGRVIIKLVNRTDLPFEIDKLVLVDSAGVKPKKSFKQKVKLRIYKMSKGVLNFAPVKKLFPDALENLRRKNGSADYNSASPLMRQCLVKVVNEDLTHLMPSIKQPVLLIWGSNDTATPLSDAQLMEKLMPEAGLAVIEGVGHYSFIENQIVFNNIMKSYFKID
ncbi:MAG: alpha/beta hydrolase [Clostridiales bacterium]|nr:alpha/beta hydrolase [Clostridiales bacterium]